MKRIENVIGDIAFWLFITCPLWMFAWRLIFG